jgi:H+-translocating NAD(P) transhydrogenase subunit beta
MNPTPQGDHGSGLWPRGGSNVDHAHQVYVLKRGQARGYASVENELFYADNCGKVYGDAQAVLVAMIQAVKDLGEEGGLKAAA